MILRKVGNFTEKGASFHFVFLNKKSQSLKHSNVLLTWDDWANQDHPVSNKKTKPIADGFVSVIAKTLSQRVKNND